MKIVIQCAGGKNACAGMMRTTAGKPVMFFGNPQTAPSHPDYRYAKPDDLADDGNSWRDRLLAYNEKHQGSGDNPHNLLPAWQLYKHKAYGKLVDKYGDKNVYILSAGWGLIPASFLTPNYNITYSQQAEPYKRRRKKDLYKDFCLLPRGGADRLVFFGGKDYLESFCGLTEDHGGERIAYYNTGTVPDAKGVILKKYNTTTKTNWHYECAQAFMDGRISLP